MSNDTNEYLQYLDVEGAKSILTKIEDARSKDGTCVNPHLTDLRNMCLWPGDVSFMKTEKPGAWRIVRTGGEVAEELVFKLHGIVVNKTLPPQRNALGKSSPRYLAQSVTLSGLGLPYFEDGANAVMQIDARLGQRAGYEQMDTCSAVKPGENREDTLTASNRYFTAKHYAENLETLPLPRSIDPRGHLQRSAGKMYVYTQENVVQYERRIVYSDGNERYEPIEPQEIMTGCIVDLQLSFMAVQTGEERFKTIAVLRVITILDDTLARSAMINCAQQLANHKTNDVSAGPTKLPLVLKRRNGNTPGMYGATRASAVEGEGGKIADDMNMDEQEQANGNTPLYKKQKRD
ncbi:hypothetical protein V5O48_003950 [Marasmius crinis-equi]|uniref:Uncharacterized protein n=1 Tax=Marasmius crinis-equi TaxID=585013 RepID=A0ABR3FRF0_9AGAR